uniref:Glutathione S-transferase n=2 Tax=Passeriformes TaxID=9126 RepID=A0A8C9KVD7_SERCA
MNFSRICYSPDFEKLKPAFLEQLPKKLQELSRFLGSRPWFAGQKLTFVDFLAYDVLDQQRMFVPECPELQGNLAQFLQRFELAHAIRLLLEYTETPYEDKLYSCGEAPDYDKSQWINEKEKLGLDFPNLPYFIDGPTKLTQSNAILRYIARKHNMCGETEEETLRVDMLENQIMDFRMSLVMVCYNPDFEKLKPGYLEQLPGKLKLFSNFLGDRKWFAGEKLTFVDFLMFDVLDQNRIFEPKCLEPFKNLKDFMERFGALEKVAAYLKSSRFQKMPINNKMAKWGNKKV